MDIRLKNNHKWGVLLIISLILLVSVATVGLYPYMQRKAEEYRQDWSEIEEAYEAEPDFENVAVQVMNFSYEIWHQKRQEEEGRLLTYSQAFLPGLDELIQKAREAGYTAGEDASSGEYASSDGYDADYYYSVQELMDEVGADWQSLYQQYGSQLAYAVAEEDASFQRSNVNQPAQYFSRPLQGDEIQFEVEFSSTGRMRITDVQGPEEYGTGLIQAASRFEFYDPLAVRLSSDYRYSGVQFVGPKDMTIIFRCDPFMFGGWGQSSAQAADAGSYGMNFRDYLGGEGMYAVVLVMLAVVGAAAIFIPFVKSFDIGRSALCRMPFEPLCAFGFIWFATFAEGSVLALVTASFVDGSLTREFLEAGFTDTAAGVLAIAVNVGFWALFYGVFYWGITCIRAVGSLGLWRYFKERTWVGQFCRFIKRWLERTLDLFRDTDWQSHSTRFIGKAVIINFLILSLISCLWFWGIGALIIYSFGLFFLIKKYWGRMEEKYQVLLDGINRMAEGSLDVEISEDLGIFNPFKDQLAKIQQGFKKAVAQEVKSERTKSELITNVSHDLKTPLTAIITYVNLLKQEGITEEERDSYIQVLDQKSMRLKALIEDLFEVSKASSGAISLHLEPVDIVSLMKQAKFELAEKMEASGIDFRFHLPEEKVILTLDGEKTYRIFENLLVNITKYGLAGTRAYIQIGENPAGWVCVTMRNISEKELTVSPEELTERFVRGDASRNTEGSGLGLAIARSFAEVQGGTMKIDIEDDIFRVTIRWKKESGPEDGKDHGLEGGAGGLGDENTADGAGADAGGNAVAAAPAGDGKTDGAANGTRAKVSEKFQSVKDRIRGRLQRS